MRRPTLLASATCLTVLGASTHARAEGRPAAKVTLEQAVSLALEHHPDALTGDAQLEEAQAARAQARGAFGPRVHVDANLQQWSSPYTINFGMPFTVREAFTWTAGVSLIQPLTELFAIYDQYKVQDFGVDVASLRRATARRAVVLAAVQAYYRLLEAERLAEVADASVGELEAQRRQAQSQLDNGVIGKNDFLRADLALATAKQQAIAGHGRVELARGELATALGIDDADAYEPVAFTGEPPASDEPTLQGAEAHAVSRRFELQELNRAIQQAEKGVGVARTKLLPQISAIGNYTHTEGSPFSQVDSAYAGLVASWDVWDWGATSNGIGVAQARVTQSRLARRKAEEQVRLEARRAFVNAQTAREGLTVARAAVSQAEENYRIVTKKFENAAATSFDVVDAEALLTQARGQVETALYDLLIAEVALAQATGAPLPGER